MRLSLLMKLRVNVSALALAQGSNSEKNAYMCAQKVIPETLIESA